MELLTGKSYDTYAIALGNFDGVHLGHQQVIRTAKQKAIESKCKSAVVTFSPHPARVLSAYKFTEILSLKDKITIVKSLGIDEVITINFTEDFSKMSAESFIKELCQKFTIKSITTGYNFRFGCDRQGDIHTIHSRKNVYNFKFNIINQVLHNSSPVSSSILRQVIKAGCIKLFSDLTGRKYSIECQYSDCINNSHLYTILNSDLLLPPNAVYLGEIENKRYCVFLVGSQVIVKPLDQGIKIPTNHTKIKLLTILGQESYLDKTFSDEIQMRIYIKKAKFC